MNNTASTGWELIEREFLRIYPGQNNPLHFAAMIKWRFGGNDPLDGISLYEGKDYWHFVTFGLSELYEKVSGNSELSGYGYEMTFKLKKDTYDDLNKEIRCVCQILQTLARITFKQGIVFGPNEFIRTGQTVGIDSKGESDIRGFICISDPSVYTIDTPNGKVAFIEMIGMTEDELLSLSTRDSVKNIYSKLGSDITDYKRKSV
ncbi:MAG: suppressor of fused domain protein, partial [Oscillospiraceae bacterium]|nr:suppressor of fused domain protein [Oscillospiraceae bacterium]